MDGAFCGLCACRATAPLPFGHRPHGLLTSNRATGTIGPMGRLEVPIEGRVKKRNAALFLLPRARPEGPCARRQKRMDGRIKSGQKGEWTRWVPKPSWCACRTTRVATPSVPPILRQAQDEVVFVANTNRAAVIASGQGLRGNPERQAPGLKDKARINAGQKRGITAYLRSNQP